MVRILHVEDNQLIAGMVKDTLEWQGWEVETCFDGSIALEKIAGETHYDLLLMDNCLPGMNGIELAQRARNLENRQHTPIVMLSAALDEAKARHAGADAFLHKPEDILVLAETITRLLTRPK